jgi:hypothetical protein
MTLIGDSSMAEPLVEGSVESGNSSRKGKGKLLAMADLLPLRSTPLPDEALHGREDRPLLRHGILGRAILAIGLDRKHLYASEAASWLKQHQA